MRLLSPQLAIALLVIFLGCFPLQAGYIWENYNVPNQTGQIANDFEIQFTGGGPLNVVSVYTGNLNGFASGTCNPLVGPPVTCIWYGTDFVPNATAHVGVAFEPVDGIWVASAFWTNQYLSNGVLITNNIGNVCLLNTSPSGDPEWTFSSFCPVSLYAGDVSESAVSDTETPLENLTWVNAGLGSALSDFQIPVGGVAVVPMPTILSGQYFRLQFDLFSDPAETNSSLIEQVSLQYEQVPEPATFALAAAALALLVLRRFVSRFGSC